MTRKMTVAAIQTSYGDDLQAAGDELATIAIDTYYAAD